MSDETKCNHVYARVHCNGCADAAALRDQLAEANTELGAYRHGYTTWTNDKGETEPSARTFRAMWSGLLSKCADYRALEADLRSRLTTAEALALTNGERVTRAEALLAKRHGMECPTYSDGTGTCGGCEVSAFLAPAAIPEGTPTTKPRECSAQGCGRHVGDCPHGDRR